MDHMAGMRLERLTLLSLLGALLLVAAGPTSAHAIDPAKAPPSIETDLESPKVFLERLRHIEEVLSKSGQRPLFVQRPPVIPLTDSASLFNSDVYSNDGQGVPYLSLKLHLFNATPNPQVLDPSKVSLLVNGKSVGFKDVPERIRDFTIDLAGRKVSVSDGILSSPLTLPPGVVTSLPMVFAPVENRGPIPALILKLEFNGSVVELDLNRLHRGVLESEISRLGPAGSCAVVTIDGSLDGINAASLAEDLQKISEAGVRRYVISWGPRATAPSADLAGWLASMAVDGEIGGQYRQLPSLPTSVVELHFAQVPEGTPRDFLEESRGRQHATVDEAVSGALATAYRVATRGMILDELDHGDRRVRASVLTSGRNLFRSADVPRLEALTRDESGDTRQAACLVIGGLDDDKARNCLKELVRSGPPRTSQAALEALLSSRIEANVAAGIEASRGPTTISASQLLNIQISSRLPVFYDRVREAALSESRDTRLKAIKSLSNPGIPAGRTFFSEVLASSEPAIRDAAFQSAAARLGAGDQQLRGLVIGEALRRLAANPRDAEARKVGFETRDARFVPVAVAQIKSPKSISLEKLDWIELLGRIGGSAAVEAMVTLAPQVDRELQGTILKHLATQDPASALRMSMAALNQPPSELTQRAREVLVHEGSDDAVRALAKAIKQDGGEETRQILQSLAAIGTPCAVEQLEARMRSPSPSLRHDAEIAMQAYWSRSPAWEVVERANLTLNQQTPSKRSDILEAMKLFDAAREIDPLLPAAYRGRGNAALRLENWTEAARNFEAAMELDPSDEISLTGLTVAWVMLGREQDALEWLEAGSKYFDGDRNTMQNYFYNSACTYSRAAMMRLRQPESAERDEAVARLKTTAFERLTAAINLQFADVALLEQDPDLENLHDDPRFQRALESAKANQ